MRILLVAHHLPPRHAAGTETYTVRLAAELARRHDVVVFATDDDPTLAPGSTRARTGRGFRIVEFAEPRRVDRPDASWESPSAEAAFAAVVAETKPDVVHFQNVRFLGFGVVAAARRAGAKTIFTLNDHWLICARDGLLVDRDGAFCAGPEAERCGRCLVGYRYGLSAAEARAGRVVARLRAAGVDLAPSLRRLALLGRRRRAAAPPDADAIAASEAVVARRRAALRPLVAAVDRFVAPSRFIADVHVRAGFPEARIRVLPYGVDGARPVRDGVARPTRIGFFGVVAPHKGVDVLVDAAAALPPGSAEIVVHGRDDQRPEYVGPLKRRASALGIRFTGAYAADDGPKLVAACDLVVVPSRWPENLPQAALEARACGVPVVAAAAGGLREIVNDDVDGALFPPGDAAALGRILVRFATDADLRARWRAAVRAPATIAEHGIEVERCYASCDAAAGASP